ncbi:MAG: hypothetical protein OXQ29_20380 [Rhodospirillaceae bacterium]|nr:hypothetical protein [Rhodospirillaceae bacterium]
MPPTTLKGTIYEPANGPTLYEGEYYERERQGFKEPHGRGTLTLRPDRRADFPIKSYKGEWADGAPHGQGILTLNDGTCYEGEWEWYEQRRGNFSGNKSHWFDYVNADYWKLRGGQGTKTLPNGVRYEGEWHSPDNESDEEIFVTKREALLHGQGTETWPDGERYEGQWHEGKLYRGILTLPDGTRYEGEWQTGYLGRAVAGHDYVGPTPPDGMRDPARHTYRSRSERDFDNLYGQGKLTLPDGTCSQGEWRNGKLHGQGSENWADGEQFEGEFRYGAAWRGALTTPDGARIEYRYGTPISAFKA